MTETSDHYMEDSLWEVTRFLESENIDKSHLSEKLIDDMAIIITRTSMTMRWMKNTPCGQRSARYCKKTMWSSKALKNGFRNRAKAQERYEYETS